MNRELITAAVNRILEAEAAVDAGFQELGDCLPEGTTVYWKLPGGREPTYFRFCEKLKGNCYDGTGLHIPPESDNVIVVEIKA